MTRSNLITSVVVPTFNRCRKLIRLLDSFEQLQEADVKEVIVVDDCSEDRTEAAVAAWLRQPHWFAAKYARTRANRGPAAARNLGIQIAAGNLIAFTDDDCVVHPRWLTNLLKPLDTDGGIVGVGGTVQPLNSHLFAQYFTFHHILEPAPTLLYLVTANCCFLRDLVLAAGGFDTDLERPGGEDVALSFKLYKRGYRFAMAEDAVVYHDYRWGLADFYRTFLNYGLGCRYVTDKYFGQGAVEQ